MLGLAGVLEVLRLAGVREVEEVGLAGVLEVQELAELLRALQEPSVVQPSAAERQYYRPGRRSMLPPRRPPLPPLRLPPRYPKRGSCAPCDSRGRF